MSPIEVSIREVRTFHCYCKRCEHSNEYGDRSLAEWWATWHRCEARSRRRFADSRVPTEAPS